MLDVPSAVVTPSLQGRLFFLDGPGGTGKTFTYQVILAIVRARGDVALATATSGVAAQLLPKGRTAHSAFRIPLKVDHQSLCRYGLSTNLHWPAWQCSALSHSAAHCHTVP